MGNDIPLIILVPVVLLAIVVGVVFAAVFWGGIAYVLVWLAAKIGLVTFSWPVVGFVAVVLMILGVLFSDSPGDR